MGVNCMPSCWLTLQCASLLSILMFLVGVVKYAERIWALKCSTMDSIRSSLNKSRGSNDHYTIPNGVKGEFDEQVLLEVAHSLLLFHFSNGLGGLSGVDVAITYALLGGALFMEVTALLGAIGSTWTLAFLCALPMRWSWLRHALVCSRRWHRLRRLLLTLSRLDIRTRRRWSGNIGQYNLLHLCACASSDPLGRLAEILGLKERWNKFHYSRTFMVPEVVKKLVFYRHGKLMSKSRHVTALGLLRAKWGKWALDKNGLYYDVFKGYDYLLGVELQEGILIWHIATDVFLANRENQEDTAAAHDVVAAIKVLSNYMMFHLVRRPDLLPGLVLNRVYQLTCENLVDIWHGSLQREKLEVILYREKDNLDFKSSELRVQFGVEVADKLIQKEKAGPTDILGVLLDVWMDFLSYAANRCSRESYINRLNNGGELIAILWLMAAHFEPENRASSR